MVLNNDISILISNKLYHSKYNENKLHLSRLKRNLKEHQENILKMENDNLAIKNLALNLIRYYSILKKILRHFQIKLKFNRFLVTTKNLIPEKCDHAHITQEVILKYCQHYMNFLNRKS